MALLRRVMTAIEAFAPLSLADTTWDNVGLLVEAPEPQPDFTSVALTLDLSPSVIQECIDKKAGVLVSYHPVIFPNLKRITLADPKQRAVAMAIRHGISIYCPHTALDNSPVGINDWIVRGVCGNDAVDVQVGLGEGGRGTFAAPRALSDVVELVKQHFGVKTVRVALGAGHTMASTVSTVAVCPGSGSSVLRPSAGKVDVLLTGEMSHHEVLALSQAGSTCVLLEHGSSERGYLAKELLPRVKEGLADDTIVFCCEKDTDVIVYH